MDGLTNDERISAWVASWSPSFDGKAIVNADFTFRAVNQQFCKIVGVSPGELVGNKFSDLTPEPVKSVEVKNAIMVKNGVIQSYLLPKTYEFYNGRKVDVTLLVNGVYHPVTKEFMFFVATIMERVVLSSSVVPSQTPTGLMAWVDKTKVGTPILAAIGMGIAYCIERLIKFLN